MRGLCLAWVRTSFQAVVESLKGFAKRTFRGRGGDVIEVNLISPKSAWLQISGSCVTTHFFKNRVMVVLDVVGSMTLLCNRFTVKKVQYYQVLKVN